MGARNPAATLFLGDHHSLALVVTTGALASRAFSRRRWPSEPAPVPSAGNLHERVDERLLLELMAQAGPVADVHIPRDRETRRHRGYAFAEYETEESARYALELFSAQPIYLYHRLMRFMANKQRRQVPASPYDMGQLDGGFLDPTRQQACLPLPLQFLPAYGAPSPYTTAPTSFAGRGYDVATGQSGQSHLDNPSAGADGGPLLPSPLQTT
eukprot:SM000076S21775  [mRNA]  locus=s76:135278:136793:- [translate_table: standard]